MQLKKEVKLAGTLFLIVGIVFVVAGIIAMCQGASLKQRCTEETIGTVVEVIRETSNSTTTDSTYTYFPVIEYQVGDRTISQKSRTGQNPPKYQVGQQVEICYNPNNVEEFIIKGDSSPQIFGFAFIILGSVAVAVGLFIFVKNAGKLEKSEE